VSVVRTKPLKIMKKRVIFGVFLIAYSAFVLMQLSCKKEDPPEKPTLSTLPVSDISETTAKSGGNITVDGGSEVDSKGIVWDTISGPTVESFIGITMEGGGSGVFLSVLNSLTPSTTYYVRAYATNSAGTAYGAQQMFTTQVPITTLPTVTTSPVNSITQTTASGGGNVTSQGGSAIIARGVCWSTSPAPTIADSTTSNGTGTGSFTSSITGLISSTTYYLRAYATNSAGTAYGNEVGFSTPLPCAGVIAPSGFGIVSSSGKCWLDRNLGATLVATNSTDASAYGHLYQWGRGTDGHQVRTSSITTTLSSSDQPGHGNFIIVTNLPYDWRSPQNENLWQGVNGVNNPCPSGWRVPTEAEWEAERLSWSSSNAAGAFASPLKLPMGGYRDGYNGSLSHAGSVGRYWSSTCVSSFSMQLLFASNSSTMLSTDRAIGKSVRCLKD